MPCDFEKYTLIDLIKATNGKGDYDERQKELTRVTIAYLTPGKTKLEEIWLPGDKEPEKPKLRMARVTKIEK